MISYLVLNQAGVNGLEKTLSANLENTQAKKSELLIFIDETQAELKAQLEEQYKSFLTAKRLVIIPVAGDSNWGEKVKAGLKKAKGKHVVILDDHEYNQHAEHNLSQLQDNEFIVDESMILDNTIGQIAAPKTAVSRAGKFTNAHELIDGLIKDGFVRITSEKTTLPTMPEGIAFID